MKLKKIYAIFLSTAIAATSCAHASNPTPGSLSCGDAQGSMLGASAAQAQPSQTPGIQITGDKSATTLLPMEEAPTTVVPTVRRAGLVHLNALSESERCEAYNTLSQIKQYIVSHRGDDLADLVKYVETILPRDRACYYRTPSDWLGPLPGYCLRDGRTVVDDLVRYFKYPDHRLAHNRKTDIMKDVIAFVLATVTDLPVYRFPELSYLYLPWGKDTSGWLEKMSALFD